MNVTARTNTRYGTRDGTRDNSRFASADPRQNQLLAALPDCDWSRWLPHLESVDFPAGKELCGTHSGSGFVYFPTSAVVSLLYRTVEGGTAEIAVIGNDGVVGFSMIMGGNATLCQALVQAEGRGFRIRSQWVQNEVDRGGPVLQLMLRYTQSLITQVAQTAVCNRHHGIDQQLARRLLVGLDRSPSDELALTQEGLASLLGVRREGVTAAALKLQQAGVIRYQRGHISVLDRTGLERRTCECYATVAKEQNRLLPNATLRQHRESMLAAA